MNYPRSTGGGQAIKRKPIFDAVRKLLGRGFTQGEVSRLDKAIDRALDETALELEDENVREEELVCAVSHVGIDLIKQFEGCAKIREDGMIEAYPDPGTGADPWTIGWGATHMEGRNVCHGDCITQEMADALFEEHLSSYAEEVAGALGDAPRTQAQFDALVSFHYNTGAIHRATLTRKHLAGDVDGAAEEFARWTRAGGKVMRGLVRRRNAEIELYRSGC